MYHERQIIEDRPDLFVVLSLWFAQFWRQLGWMLVALPVVLVICTVVGMIAGIAIKILGGSLDGLSMQVQLLGAVLGFVGGIWAQMRAWRGMLGRTYGGLRLVLLREAALESA